MIRYFNYDKGIKLERIKLSLLYKIDWIIKN